MKARKISAVIVAVALAGAVMAGAGGPGGGGGRRGDGGAAAPVETARNMALFATPSTSFVSGNETLGAINDGFEPRNQGDHSHGAYGNWNRTGLQWVQYDWSKPISTNKTAVYWWADGQGIHLPTSARVLYWNGSAFVPVQDSQVMGVAGGQYNTVTFTEVTTTKIRLEMTGDGTNSTGIIEWKVFDSGKSPKFPPTVMAGIERSVVMPAKTFLTGRTKGADAHTTWVKESGPGDVAFDNAGQLVTRAGFSEPGDYVLKLSAAEGDLSSSDTVKVHVQQDEFSARLEPVYTKSYKIDSPLWSNRAKALIVNWIPHLMDECSNLNLREGGINNIIQAGNKLAGKPWTPHVGYPFANAWVYNTLEAMCVAMQVDPQGDPEIIAAQQSMKAKIDEWVPIMLASQEPDGYMQSRFTLGTARENGRAPGHWSQAGYGEHEGYVAGYILEAAIANYLYTGGKDTRMYDCAKRLADCWDNNIGPTPKKAWHDGHENMEQALVRFGRFVNDVEGTYPDGPAKGAGKGDKYIRLAKFLLDCRKNGTEYDQSQTPVIEQYEAVGHAVRASYAYSGMADIVMETRDPDYASAVASIWDDIVNRKIYITGGIGSGETSEGFGSDYSLQNNAYCESCSNCGQLFFQYKMNMAYHDSKYVDLYEETLYNAILGDIDYEGKNFCYTNALDVTGAPSGPMPRNGVVRYAWHTCPCCVGNLARTLLMLPTWSYAKDAGNLYVNLFIGGTMTVENVAGTDVEMVQKTDYPWNGQVAITVNPKQSKQFAIRVRVPARSVSDLYASTPDADGITSLKVNGEAVQGKPENGYMVINRQWKAGDKIEMELPMVPQRVKALDQVAADRGRVAIKYGPLVYNFESVDQNVVDSVLAPSSALKAEWKPDLLGGIMTITGKFSSGSPMVAIPNYARSNRGGRSLVWIKDR